MELETWLLRYNIEFLLFFEDNVYILYFINIIICTLSGMIKDGRQFCVVQMKLEPNESSTEWDDQTVAPVWTGSVSPVSSSLLVAGWTQERFQVLWKLLHLRRCQEYGEPVSSWPLLMQSAPPCRPIPHPITLASPGGSTRLRIDRVAETENASWCWRT